MIFTKCKLCGKVYCVVGRSIDEVRSLLSEPQWRVDLPCVIPGCPGRSTIVGTLCVEQATTIPVHAYYRALHGLGLSVGSLASAERVRDLLLTKRISALSLEPVGDPERTILKGIILEDGTRLHFASSARGACVYFIEEVTRVDNHLSTEGDSSSNIEDRSKTRHIAKKVEGSERACAPDGVPGASGSNEPETNCLPPDHPGGSIDGCR